MANQSYSQSAWFRGQKKCPVSGLAITHPMRFVSQLPGSNFSMEMATLGNWIILVKASGYMRSIDEDEFLACFEDYRTRHLFEQSGIIVVEDYGEIQGADTEARKKYVDYFTNSEFLLAGIVYNLSPLFKISFNLAKRLLVDQKHLYAENSYARAIQRAAKIINQSGTDRLDVAFQSISTHKKPPLKAGVAYLKGRFNQIQLNYLQFRRYLFFFLNRPLTRHYSDVLLKYIASFDWQQDGTHQKALPKYSDPAIRQVFDAVGFIKSEVDRLMQQRLEAEKELKESELRYRQLVEHARAGILEFDFSTKRILSLNEAILQFTEYTKDEMLAMNPLNLMTAESRKVYEKRVGKLVAGETLPYEMAYQMKTKSGKYKWALFNTKLFFKDGRPEKASVVLSDISEMKRIEGKLLDYQEKLKGLSIQLSKTQETERRKLASRLHDSVSQELFVAQLQLNALAKKTDDEDQALELKGIRDRIQKIIKDTKALTFDLSPPVLYDFGLREAIRSLAESVAQTHGVSVQTDFSEDADGLEGDINIILYRSINELFHNTLKHARADRIFISVNNEGDLLVVEFQDNGIGFDIDQTAAEAAAYQGFGLFDIREKINHLGGAVEIDSAAGNGTHVKMSLPLTGENGQLDCRKAGIPIN